MSSAATRRADTQEKQERVRQRREQRAARWAGRWARAPRWAERAVFVLPILFPMAVAWVGQIRFAMGVMGWNLPAAVVFAAGFELSTAYVARLDWRSRAAGDSGLLFRGATWAFAAGAATMNYWHAAGPRFAPNGAAVSYGLMSVTGVVLWELWSTYRHRTALRAEGKLPAARPRYGLARWVWFRPLTRLAWLLALRDGYTTTEQAWRAAVSAVQVYGSARAARKAVRAGRPVPVEDAAGREAAVSPERDAPARRVRRDTNRGSKSRPETTVPEQRPAAGDGTAPASMPHAGGKNRKSTGAVAERMKLHALDLQTQGVPVTGADLDRAFGTRDYGRRVLRTLAAGPRPGRSR